MNKEKCYIGIDIGKYGGVAVLTDNTILSCYTIPLIGTEVSLQELIQIFQKIKENYNIVIVGIEDVHSIHGSSAKSNFQFGRICGMIEAITATLQLSYQKITPKTWQKVVWQGVPLITLGLTSKQLEEIKKTDKEVKRQTDTKATSLLAAQRLFPNNNFLATERSKKPHDGLVDASLIAFYLKQQYKHE